MLRVLSDKAGNAQGTFRQIRQNAQGTFRRIRQCTGNFQTNWAMLRELSDKFGKMLRELSDKSGNAQGTF
jgi:ElaB/YqjD/DUF883 family membrane-anchored ribosome-binding protein